MGDKRRIWPIYSKSHYQPGGGVSRGRGGRERQTAEGGEHNEMHGAISQSPKMTLTAPNMESQ